MHHALSRPDEEDESGASQGRLGAHLLQDGGMERQHSVPPTPGDEDVEIPRETVDQREPRSEKQELWPGAQKVPSRSNWHASVIQVENLLSGGPYPISDQSDHPKPEAAQSQP